MPSPTKGRFGIPLKNPKPHPESGAPREVLALPAPSPASPITAPTASHSQKLARAKLAEYFDSLNFDPIKDLVQICTAKKPNGKFVAKEDVRVGILKELAQYRYPKLKAIDVESNMKGTVNVTVVRYGAPKVEYMGEQRELVEAK